jgi:hypothetical protein
MVGVRTCFTAAIPVSPCFPLLPGSSVASSSRNGPPCSPGWWFGHDESLSGSWAQLPYGNDAFSRQRVLAHIELLHRTYPSVRYCNCTAVIGMLAHPSARDSSALGAPKTRHWLRTAGKAWG